MAKPNISGAITPAQKTTMKGNIDANKAIIAPFAFNLTPQERKEGQKLGPNSVSYGMGALKTAEEHPVIVPPGFVIAEFRKDVTLFFDLDELENHHREYTELINDTKMAVGMEVMKQANRLYAHAKLEAKHDAALDTVLKYLGKRYDREGKRSLGINFTVAEKTSVSVDKVVPGCRIINDGTTVLMLEAGNDTVNKVKKAAMKILPGDSLVVPKGYTSIIVQNTSETTPGSFYVRVK